MDASDLGELQQLASDVIQLIDGETGGNSFRMEPEEKHGLSHGYSERSLGAVGLTCLLATGYYYDYTRGELVFFIELL